jgi:hypothetical protein
VEVLKLWKDLVLARHHGNSNTWISVTAWLEPVDTQYWQIISAAGYGHRLL